MANDATSDMNPEAVKYFEKAGFISVINLLETSSYTQPNNKFQNLFIQN